MGITTDKILMYVAEELKGDFYPTSLPEKYLFIPNRATNKTGEFSMTFSEKTGEITSTWNTPLIKEKFRRAVKVAMKEYYGED